MALGLAVALAGLAQGQSPRHPLPLPLPAGAVVVQTLNFTGGERESFMSLDEVSEKGVRYGWQFRELKAAGDTIEARYDFFEAASDVVASSRLWVYHSHQGSGEHPDYTMMAISRATYRRLLAARSDTFQVMTIQSPGGAASAAFGWLGAPRATPIRYRGTVSLLEPAPAGFPLLVSGRRVEVPALHLRASLTARGRTWTPDLWVLADTTYPLILKWVGAADAPENVLQTVRVDLPQANPSREGAVGGANGTLEGALATDCRVELPGIYFAFNSAELQPASDQAIAALADVLARHPDWTGTIEGHTDSVGTAAANLALSERRAEAVRARLAGAHKVDGARLATVGYGSSRPREPNSTIEGRARNRRVELVRACAGR
ncbi:MAG TPA: OmpA family protein [Gemmatimonadales bacterium]|nr:OmpA family protein [Gemmatimonadales bacterium]